MGEKRVYGSLRLPKRSIEKLKDVRLAFEANYMQRITNGRLIDMLIACLEDAEPAVWETYCNIVDKKDE